LTAPAESHIITKPSGIDPEGTRSDRKDRACARSCLANRIPTRDSRIASARGWNSVRASFLAHFPIDLSWGLPVPACTRRRRPAVHRTRPALRGRAVYLSNRILCRHLIWFLRELCRRHGSLASRVARARIFPRAVHGGDVTGARPRRAGPRPRSRPSRRFGPECGRRPRPARTRGLVPKPASA